MLEGDLARALIQTARNVSSSYARRSRMHAHSAQQMDQHRFPKQHWHVRMMDVFGSTGVLQAGI